MRVGEGLEEDSFNDAEDCDIGANADCQSDERDECEERGAAEAADDLAKLAGEVHGGLLHEEWPRGGRAAEEKYASGEQKVHEGGVERMTCRYRPSRRRAFAKISIGKNACFAERLRHTLIAQRRGLV